MESPRNPKPMADTAPPPNSRPFQFPVRFVPLFATTGRWPVYVMNGGRSGAKTTTASTGVVYRTLQVEETEGRPFRTVCVRQTQKSLRDSAKHAIERRIGEGGDSTAGFRVLDNEIRTPLGGVITFQGMSTSHGTAISIKGLEDYDLIWFEEAEYISQAVYDLLTPTIFRKAGAELWFTLNINSRLNPVYRDFFPGGTMADVACFIHSNFMDLPKAWQAPEQERLRANWQENRPDTYAHEWLGEPLEISDNPKVLPFPDLLIAREAWNKWAPKLSGGLVHAGLDVGDRIDPSSLAGRRGAALFHLSAWHAPRLGVTSKRADTWMRDHGGSVLNYDASGMGAGIRSDLGGMDDRPYSAYPEHNGGKVEAPELTFSYGVTNADHFVNRYAQMSWGVKMRLENTIRLVVAHEDIDPDSCLFIHPSITDTQLSVLAQPEYSAETTTSRIKVEKQPKPEGAPTAAKPPSPHEYDATAYAFARDSVNGLTTL